MSKFFAILGLIGLIVFGILADYYWPETAEGYVTLDPRTSGDVNNHSYMIGLTRDDGKTMVFRNEDSWVMLKIRTTDIQTTAGDASINKKRVRIRYYGWRSQLFNRFWNVLSVTIIDQK